MNPESSSPHTPLAPAQPPEDRLLTPVQFVRGVGPQRALLLKNLNIETARDLLFHIPHDIHDFTNLRPVPQLQPEILQAVQGVVADRDGRSLRNGGSLTAILLNCDGHFVRGLWFNQPWMLRRYQHGDRLLFHGKPRRREGRWEFNNPEVHVLPVDEDSDERTGVLPRYPLTEGIRMDAMRRLTRAALEHCQDAITDPLPAFYRQQHQLPELAESLRALHLPETRPQWEAARQRVLLDDLLEFQIGLALRRHSTRQLAAVPIPVTAQIDARIRRLFNFRFTPGQDQATHDITRDLALPQPMHRLLQADVGAGKTAIAVYAMLAAIAAGRQAVLMAPTEVLANQHWETIDQLLAASRVNRCLLLGGLPAARRRELTTGIVDGSIQLVIGTQALIQDSIRFAKLGVAVIDEQHRFGVRQRAGFSGNKHSADGTSPHILIMTATPIPRSLCLTQFGDLEVSIIRDLPPGRQKVVTARVNNPEELSKVWNFLRQQISRGRQAYVVCPRVEGQSEDDAAAAETVFLKLCQNELQGLSVELLHGRMEREHRHAVMDRFHYGQTQVLVATTVIEVGVNVPNATIMVIQQAERFGIAQLHQLRGRICRGSHQGYCFLLSDTQAPDAANRLAALVQSSDGFELADKDAQIRGPGDILGLRQSGAMPLRFADPVRDLQLLQHTRVLAQNLVDSGELNLPAFLSLKQIVLHRFHGLLELPQTG